jgi:hypothetical protein
VGENRHEHKASGARGSDPTDPPSSQAPSDKVSLGHVGRHGLMVGT